MDNLEKEQAFYQELLNKIPAEREEINQSIIYHENALQNPLTDGDVVIHSRALLRANFQNQFIQHVSRHMWNFAIEVEGIHKDDEDDPPKIKKQTKRLYAKLSKELIDIIRNDNKKGRQITSASLPHSLDPKTTVHTILTSPGIEFHRLAVGNAKVVEHNDHDWYLLNDDEQNSVLEIKDDIRSPIDIGNLSKDQIDKFHMPPDVNFIVHGVAGSGKTQWGLLRPLYLSLGLNHPLKIKVSDREEEIEIEPFQPLDISKTIGLTHNQILVTSLKSILQQYNNYPIKDMPIFSWDEIQLKILNNISQQSIDLPLDFTPKSLLQKSNIWGIKSVYEHIKCFVNYSIFSNFYHKLRGVNSNISNISYECYISKFTSDKKMSLSEEFTHLHEPQKFKLSELKADWELFKDAIEDLRENESFDQWIVNQICHHMKLFTIKISNQYQRSLILNTTKKHIRSLMRDLGKRSLLSNEIEVSRDLKGFEFDFISLYLLENTSIEIFDEDMKDRFHIFIDEYQDFSDVQNELILKMCSPSNSSITKVGDYAQQLTLSDHVSRKSPNYEYVNFYENYRQTPYLANFSSDFRKVIQGNELVPRLPKRGGLIESNQKPFIFPNKIDELIKLVKSDLESELITNTCIIVSSREELDKVLYEMRRASVNVIELTEDSYQNRDNKIFVALPKTTKGLEFDAAYVLGVYTYTTPHQINQLYVAFTRPRLKLGLSINPLHGNLPAIRLDLEDLLTKHCQ